MFTRRNVYVNHNSIQLCQNSYETASSDSVNLEARERLKAALSPLIEKKQLRAYARSIHVSPATVSKWLNGDSFPDGDNRDRVAASLGMSLDRFNQEIVQGRETQKTSPLEQSLRWIETAASRSELATILHAVADKLAAR